MDAIAVVKIEYYQRVSISLCGHQTHGGVLIFTPSRRKKMSVIRVNKTKDYSVMSNYHLKDKNLSLKAKGLLSVMLSLPDDWDYSINGLAQISQEGTKAIRSALQELEQVGYLIRLKTTDKNGRFDYIYDIYEMPSPYYREGHTVEGHTVKELQENNNKLNIKESNIKIDKESIQENTIMALFDEFWKVYPRKVDKKGSYKAFKRIPNIIEIAPDIIASVQEKKGSKQWQDSQYIPHPTTYLHQERWLEKTDETSLDEWYDGYWNNVMKEIERKEKENE